MGNSITIQNEQQLEEHIKHLRADFDKHKFLKLTIESGIRTISQNKSLHLYCEQVAVALNDAGYDVRTFFRDDFVVPFSQHIVKDNMWRKIQKAITGKESTTKASKKEYIEIYEHMNRLLADKGIHVPWPSNDNLMNSQRVK